MLKVYRNLYHHNKKWYAVVDGSSNASSIDEGVASNTMLVKLPTTDSKAFQENLKVCYVPGVTLYVDFPFPAFPDNLGHWAELLLPLHSALSSSSWAQHLQGGHKHIDRLLLGNVRPHLLYNWPKEMLALALAPALPPWPAPAAAPAPAPAKHKQQQQQQQPLPAGAVPWDRPLPQLLGADDVSGWCAHGWMLFENVVVAQDRYPLLAMPDRQLPQPPAAALVSSQAGDVASSSSSSSRSGGGAEEEPRQQQQQQQDAGLWNTEHRVGFNRPELAAQFRAAAHARHLWGPPFQQQQQQQQGAEGAGSSSSSSTLPRMVTVLLYPEDYPPVVNHYELVDMLRDLAEPYGFKVRTVSLTMGAPFLSHMATMAGTGLLIARHGPLLASAVLLPPGAAVLELLPYKWQWRDVSSLYRNMTASTGQLHHWAWRPLDAKWCRYKEAAHARYAGWTTQECSGRECLLVHAQAGLEADLSALRQLLQRKLPGLLAGQSVAELAEPWPAAD